MTESHRLSRFFTVAGIELLLAGLFTAFQAVSQGFRTTTLLSVFLMIIGGGALLMPFVLRKWITLHSVLIRFLYNRYGIFLSFAIPVGITVFLFTRTPDIESLGVIGAVIVGLWLIGLEILFFFGDETREISQINSPATRLSLVSLILAYGIVFIPSRIPSLLDGFPWNTPLEFITATLLLPCVFFFGRKLLSKKAVTLLLTLLFAAKFILVFFLPQAGLGVWTYTTQEKLDSDQWQRSYETFWTPSYTQVTQTPYRSFREFPVEWINFHQFEKDSFWLALKLDGYISLQPDERLVFVIQGAQSQNINLLNLETQKITSAIVVKSSSDLDAKMFVGIPYAPRVEITGALVFPNYGQFRFEPLILNADGSARSASPEIWLDKNAPDFPIIPFQYALDGIAILLLILLLASMLDGLISLYQTGRINLIDLYLAATGFILYYFTNAADKPAINLPFIAIVAVLLSIKLLDLTLHHRPYSRISYFISIGIPFLLMFLALDMGQLRSVVILPPYQDAMEYQMLARNIYVARDTFLLQTPPWSYKVLFPYVIGFLHILFGQSMSAQLFLNAWSAVLTTILMADLALYFGLSGRNAYVASSAFLVLLLLPVSFIYYFRFGLIEPVAITCLLAAGYFAKERKFWAMFITGVVTGMLRLNFGGAIFTVVTFFSTSIVGGRKEAWISFLKWCQVNWKRLLVYLVAIPAPALLITFLYSHFIPTYTLSPDMNQQTSIASVMQSLMIVIIGGDAEFLQLRLKSDPIGVALITLPIVIGLLIAFMSLIVRKGIWSQIDLRLSLFLLSMLPVYAVLKPIAYFPRYSWSFLPPAILLIALLIQYAFSKDKSKFNEAQF